jgi:Mn2+/Fe2+ NRAMP family transporter
VIIISVAAGVGFDFAGFNPIKLLYATAVINGMLAPFLLTGILIAASDKKLMRGQPSSRLGRITVGVTTVVMFAATIGMFVF